MTFNQSKIKVITYTEIIGLIIIFSTILYLLYPKAMLENQILSESSNYDLTSRYLKNMLRLDPSNRVLMFTLAKTALKQNKIDLTLRLTHLLQENASKNEKNTILQLQYRAYKQEYLYAAKERKRALLPQLKELQNKIDFSLPLTQEEQHYWLHEMLWLQNYHHALLLVDQVLKNKPKSIYWLSQKYELLSRLHRTKEMQKTIKTLLKIDKKDHLYWLRQAYYLALQNHNTKEAAYYQDQLKTLHQTQNLSRIQKKIEQGLYLQAADIYMQLYTQSHQKEQKIRWLKEALALLQQYGFVNERTKILKSVEDDFLDDPQMVTFILKIYLESDKLEDAVALSKKLLDKTKLNGEEE